MKSLIQSFARLHVTGQSVGRMLALIALVILSVSRIVPSHGVADALAVIFAASVATVYVATPLVIRLAHWAGAVDMPGGRRIHSAPTPRWGGIAVYLGVVLALVAASVRYMPNLRALLIGSTLMLVIGVIDDAVSVRAGIKLLVQLLACALLIADGVHVTFLPPTWWGVAGEYAITVLWIVGITNALNFLDGMDGLLSGLVAGTSLIYFVLALLLQSNMMAYCSVALFGASLAFLRFNVNPARVFLGDGGSNFLGFFLATLSIQGAWSKGEPLVSFFIPVLILSVPIYDMVFTTVARIASGRVNSVRSWLEYAGRDHIHHRLEMLGLTRGWVVVTIWILNAAVGLGAIALYEARTYGGVALVAQAILVYAIVALLEVLGARNRRPAGNGAD